MNIRDQLIRDEGMVLHAYEDSLGYLTIGVGRLIDKRKGGGITEAEAFMLLDNDIERITRELERQLPWTAQLDEARRGALVNMAFQLGVAGLLQFRRALAAMRDDDWDTTAAELIGSRWAQQTPERAQRVARQIKTGDWT